MICQECGFETFFTAEDDDCPICDTPYTYRNPNLVRETGHRMPWMIYKLALKSPAAALRIVTGGEVDLVRGAELVLESPWGLELDKYEGIDMTELDLEELLRLDGGLKARMVYWKWVQDNKGFAIPTGTNDYLDPMPMDIYLHSLTSLEVHSNFLTKVFIRNN